MKPNLSLRVRSSILLPWLGLGVILASAPLAAQIAPVTTYFGASDGSAGVPLDGRFFATAEDEHNVLRIYEANPSDPAAARPVWEKDFSVFLGVKPKHECDLEGGARVGGLIFWIGSHGRGDVDNPEEKPSRRRLFATAIAKDAEGKFWLEEYGRFYDGLVDDLVKAPLLKDCHFDVAASKPTKTREGLNIEALCATPEGALLIGFRAPVWDDDHHRAALLVPLLNPLALVAKDSAAAATFGPPIWLDLGGRGFRELVRWGTGYLILAGSFDSKADFALYGWTGRTSDAPRKLPADFGGLGPEGLVAFPDDAHHILVLSDDGKAKPGEEPRFRSVWVSVPAP